MNAASTFEANSRGPTLLIGAIVCITIGLAAVSWSFVTDDSGMPYLYLLMLLQATPFLLGVARNEPTFIGLVMANHLVTYSIAKFNQLGSILGINYIYPAALSAVKCLILAETLIILTYVVVRGLLNVGKTGRTRIDKLMLTPRFLYVIGCYVVFNPILIRYLPAKYMTVNFVCNLFALLILLTSDCPQRPRLQYFIKLATFAGGLLFFMDTGSLAIAGMVGVMWFWVNCMRFSGKEFAAIVGMIFLITAIQPVKAEFRSTAITQGDVPFAARIGVLGNLLYQQYIERNPVQFEFEEANDDDEAKKTDSILSVLLGGFGRVGDDSLERVLDWTPSRVPFWGGETYATIPFLFVPRLLWPNKPQAITWNKFGRTYGFLSPEDYQTSVGVGYLAEAYMNFGYFGLVMCAIFFGTMIACLEKSIYYIFSGYYMPVYLVFAVPVMIYASDMASVLNSILIIWVVVLAFRGQILRFIRRTDIYSMSPAT